MTAACQQPMELRHGQVPVTAWQLAATSWGLQARLMAETATTFSIPAAMAATKSLFPPAVDLVVDISGSDGTKIRRLPAELRPQLSLGILRRLACPVVPITAHGGPPGLGPTLAAGEGTACKSPVVGVSVPSRPP